MLHEAQRISAPSAVSVSIRTAVWMVMWREPAMRAPLSGFLAAYSSRTAISPGISVSAMAISFRPHSASPISLPWWFIALFLLASDYKDIKNSLYVFQGNGQCRGRAGKAPVGGDKDGGRPETLGSGRQIEGGHDEEKRDELQSDPPAHQGLADLWPGPRYHVPQPKGEHDSHRAKRERNGKIDKLREVDSAG